MYEKLFDTSKSSLRRIYHSLIQENNVQLWIKQDDKIHDEVSGNKWRKLKYNFEQCLYRKNKGILTFGGAYSNHLLATASACNLAGLKSVGVVRGEELNSDSNHVLKRCAELGMQLHFVSRLEYNLRYERPYHEDLLEQFPNYMIVPEGGANYYGVIGCQEIVKEIDIPFDHLYVAQGTTATSCGILLSLKNQSLHVVPALKGFDSFNEMKSLFQSFAFESEIVDELMEKVIVHDEAHHGGYGKTTEELLEFIDFAHKELEVELDYVYTGKAFMELWQNLIAGELNDSTVIFVHTGGLFSSGVE